MTKHDQKPPDPRPPDATPTDARPPDAADPATAPPAQSIPQPAQSVLRALVDDVDAANRAIATATAQRAVAIDRLRLFSEAAAAADPHDTSSNHGWTPQVCAERELYTELAGALNVSQNTARNLVHESKQLVHELPATMAALLEGAISFAHVRVIIDNAASVPTEKIGGFEATLVPSAVELGVAKFKRVADRLRESMYPDSIDERHVEAVSRRGVWLEAADDGMATLGALVSAELAHAMMDRLNEIAMAQGPQGADRPGSELAPGEPATGEKRTLGQRRADAFTDLLLMGDTCAATVDDAGSGQPNVGHGVVAKVLVTVPVMTLLGRDDQPAHLDGYGPIDAETARELAANAPSFTRLLTHPVSSAILDFDRTTYAVPADLKLVVRVRDETCRAIGCDKPAKRSDLDHTKEWQDEGTTCLSNLACLCPDHHRVKTHTRVQMQNLPGGDIRWTLPSGRSYVTHPATRVDGLYAGALRAEDPSVGDAPPIGEVPPVGEIPPNGEVPADGTREAA